MRILSIAAARTRIQLPKLATPKYWWKLHTDAEETMAGLTGTLTGSTAFVEYSGRHAVRFNGTGGVRLPAFQLGAGPWSVSAWVNITSNATYFHMLSSTDHAELLLKVASSNDPSNGKPYLYARSMGPPSRVTAVKVPLGTWQLLTYTYTGSILTVYLNDQAIGTFSGPMNILNIGYNLGFGNNTAPEYSRGYQSDLRVFDKALTAEEVSDFFQRS